MKKTFILSALFSNLVMAASNQPITNFNAQRYLGDWYEDARLPMLFESFCQAPIIANYSLDVNTNNVVVNNTCTILNRRISAIGVGIFSEGVDVGLLDVTFVPTWARNFSFVYADYRVLDTDYDSYSLVGSKSKKYLWILSRNPTLDTVKFQQLIQEAKDNGYDTGKLIYSNVN